MLKDLAETKTGSIKARQQLKTSEVRVLRRIANKTLRGWKRNEVVRQICKVEQASDWVLSQRREQDVHVERMRDGKSIKYRQITDQSDKKQWEDRQPIRRMV